MKEEFKVIGIPKDYYFDSIIQEQLKLGFIPHMHIDKTNYDYNAGYIVFRKIEKPSFWKLLRLCISSIIYRAV